MVTLDPPGILKRSSSLEAAPVLLNSTLIEISSLRRIAQYSFQESLLIAHIRVQNPYGLA